MTTEKLALLLILCFKLATLTCGSFIIYMGYQLFKAGLLGDAGEVDGQAGKYRLIIRRAAPGTFFALFGAVIIVVSVSIGFSVELGPGTVYTDNPVVTLPVDPSTSQTVTANQVPAVVLPENPPVPH